MRFLSFSSSICLLFWAFSTIALAQPEDDYKQAMKAYRARDYGKALKAFEKACDASNSYRDACLYWMASSSFKLGEYDRAQKYLADFYQDFPQSRWLEDAQSLEAEILAEGGKLPSASSLRETSPEIVMMYASRFKAEDMLPILKSLLKDDNRPRFQQQALFALTQYKHPEARALLQQHAEQKSGQLGTLAIQYLALSGDQKNLDYLKSMYQKSTDSQVKHELLSAFMIANEFSVLEEVGRSGDDPSLAKTAIMLLGAMGQKDSLRRLFETNSSAETQQALIQALGIAQDKILLQQIFENAVDKETRKLALTQFGIMNDCEALWSIYHDSEDQDIRMACLESFLIAATCDGLPEIAKTESLVPLKEKAILLMGAHHRKYSTPLLEIYQSDDRNEVKAAVLQALFIGQDDSQLIQIIDTETQKDLKSKAIQLLGLISSDKARDYLKTLIKPQ